MTPIDLFIYITATMGLVNIIINSPIAEFFRIFLVSIFEKLGMEDLGGYFVKCPPCVSVWVGIALLPLSMNGWIIPLLPLVASFFAMVCQIYIFPDE